VPSVLRPRRQRTKLVAVQRKPADVKLNMACIDTERRRSSDRARPAGVSNVRRSCVTWCARRPGGVLHKPTASPKGSAR
jgi:hypothetical protein